MSDLANILAKLYPDRDQCRLLLHDREINLDPDQINLEGDAVLRWGRILDEGWKHHKVEKVVQVAGRRYPERAAELDEALHRYFDSRGQVYNDPATEAEVSRHSNPSLQLPLSRSGLVRYYLDRWLPRIHFFLTRVGRLREPSELSEIHKYLRGLHAKIKNDWHEKTYLPLAGRPVPPAPKIPKAANDPFVFPIHQVILQLVGRAQGGDSASAQIAAVSRKSRVVHNILKVIDEAQSPLVLLGEPGSGKTMTLQQAAMTLAERERCRVFPKAIVYIRLGEFHVNGAVQANDVREYVKQSLPPSIRSRFDALEEYGRLVIFFDGMDEMSRERYNEHTEALSLFADSSPAKTLFSCRVTDFSPKFVHHRLVLLPFNRKQMAEYLSKYIEAFPIIIEGRAWTLSQLVRHIAQGELAVEANNPFVLWLLCLYLQDKGYWPDSRVELLGFFNARNYQRKTEERSDDELAFPDMMDAFLEWGRFAYLITERNLGAAIPVCLLEAGQDAAKVNEMVQVGKRCAVFAESKDKHEYMIRFEHHRFQEYFTAYYIHQVRLDINWLDKLDAPRWQETMLNLILMGDTTNVISVFADAIREMTSLCQARIKDGWIEETSDDESDEDWLQETYRDKIENNRLKKGLTDEYETLLADRVELSSRIIRQSGSAKSGVRETLMPPFRQAVAFLAKDGSPITQVKMMRACQNVPELDFIETLREPLNSPINWVRNQALILIAGSQSSARAVGSDLATEIGYDLANGLFPTRLLAYVKAVYAAKSWRYGWSLLTGVSCYAANLLLLLAVVSAIYFSLWSLRSVRIEPHQFDALNYYKWAYFKIDEWKIPDEKLPSFLQRWKASMPEPKGMDFQSLSNLGHPLCITVFGLVLLLAIGAVLKKQPSLLWATILGSGTGTALLLPCLIALWNGSATPLGIAALASLLIFILGQGIGAFIGATIHFAILAVYLAVTAPVRHSDHGFRSFFTLARQTGRFDGPIKDAGKSLLGMVAMVIGLNVAVSIGQLLSDLSHLPFYPLVNVVIIIVAALILAFLIRAGQKGTLSLTRILGPKVMRGIRATITIVIGSLLWILIMPLLIKWLEKTPNWFLRILAIILLIGITWTLFLLMKILWHAIVAWGILRAQKFSPGEYDPERWIQQIKAADADEQHYLLSKTDHQVLSLTVSEYLDVLKEIRSIITEEPALSTYWAQRDQLEQTLKQERHG